MEQWAALLLFCCIKTAIAEKGILFSATEISPGTGGNTTAGFSESQVCWLAIFRLRVESYI